jgi:hypothetical protein
MRKAFYSTIALSLLLATLEARAADPERIAEGKRYFATGVALVNDPDGPRYEDALVQFKKAFDVLGAWKVLVNIAICSLKLERDSEAIEAYEKYLVAGGQEIDKSERADIERDLATLRVQLVRLHLDLRASGGSVVDERMDGRGSRIVNRYLGTQRTLDLGVHPGHHVITVQVGSQQARWEVDLPPGTAVNHTFDIAEPTAQVTNERTAPAPPAALRVTMFGALGLGVAGLGVGTLFAVQSHNKRSRVDALCPNDRCPVEKTDEIADLQAQASAAGKIAAASLVAGGVGIAAAGALFFVTRTREAKAEKASLSPWVGPASLGLVGRF